MFYKGLKKKETCFYVNLEIEKAEVTKYYRKIIPKEDK